MRCLAVLLFLGLIAGHVFAADEPFTNPSNWGGTGLMEVPTARVIRENAYRIGYSQINPYRYYYGVISPLKGLEIGGRITEVMGVPGFSGSAGAQYGNYKDKSLDFKYQLISEGKYMPAFAVGIMDPLTVQGSIHHSISHLASRYIRLISPWGLATEGSAKKPLPTQGEGIRVEMFQDTKQWLLDLSFSGALNSPLLRNMPLWLSIVRSNITNRQETLHKISILTSLCLQITISVSAGSR